MSLTETDANASSEVPATAGGDAPLEATSNYQMKPSLQESFRTGIVKEIIRDVLQDILKGKQYSQSNVPTWTTQIADAINSRIRDLSMRRYKHIVQVMLTQQTGAGSKYIARCVWDAECDSQISDYFTNENIVCVVSVFGVYLY